MYRYIRVLFGVREFLPRGVEVLLNLLSAGVVGTEDPICYCADVLQDIHGSANIPQGCSRGLVESPRLVPAEINRSDVLGPKQASGLVQKRILLYELRATGIILSIYECARQSSCGSQKKFVLGSALRCWAQGFLGDDSPRARDLSQALPEVDEGLRE